MAFEEYDDYEQEQLVKEWLKSNAITIVLGIALGIGGLWGYGQWQNKQVEQQQAGAVEYQQIAQVVELGELAEAGNMVADFENNFGSNLFAIKARMLLASKLIEQDQLTEAKAQYEAILASKPEQIMAEVSRLRLARLMVAMGELDAAEAELNLVQSVAYKTVVEEVKGDIFLARGENAAAKDAYQLALNDGEGYSGRQIVEMKLANVK